MRCANLVAQLKRRRALVVVGRHRCRVAARLERAQISAHRDLLAGANGHGAIQSTHAIRRRPVVTNGRRLAQIVKRVSLTGVAPPSALPSVPKPATSTASSATQLPPPPPPMPNWSSSSSTTTATDWSGTGATTTTDWADEPEWVVEPTNDADDDDGGDGAFSSLLPLARQTPTTHKRATPADIAERRQLARSIVGYATLTRYFVPFDAELTSSQQRRASIRTALAPSAPSAGRRRRPQRCVALRFVVNVILNNRLQRRRLTTSCDFWSRRAIVRPRPTCSTASSSRSKGATLLLSSIRSRSFSPSRHWF